MNSQKPSYVGGWNIYCLFQMWVKQKKENSETKHPEWPILNNKQLLQLCLLTKRTIFLPSCFLPFPFSEEAFPSGKFYSCKKAEEAAKTSFSGVRYTSVAKANKYYSKTIGTISSFS